MSLQKNINVNTHYTRSVNLERDADSIEVIQAYIPTSRALRTFSRIEDTFNKEQAPRAWSLIGPYGSGKSSFSVFLSQLLSHPTEKGTKTAQKLLSNTDKDLAKPFIKSVARTEGYLKVLITGAPESMAKRIVTGLFVAAEQYWKQRPGKNHTIVSRLRKAAEENETSVSEILNLIKDLQAALEKTNCAGILLIVDELGKFLEYEARHYGANDIFLLQALAEHACAGNKVNLLLFVLLHQSFEQYAKGLGENLKNEWSKVQGRFEEIPFLESAEQVLRVVSAAFTHDFNVQQKRTVRKNINDVLAVLNKNEALPGALTNKEALDLFSACYPLHPVSAILLPLLCQKVAQNERTLFSYLGSHEDFGLQDMLKKLDGVESYIYPHHIFDYFISNQSAVMGDYIIHRRWAEVITAIERLGDAKESEVELLKTIGILNIIGSKGGFKASKPLLEACMLSKGAFSKAAKLLVDKSVINYRKYSSEYRVWQGSDFDLEEALQEEKNNVGNFSVAKELNETKNMLPIVARKYTMKNGALRYFIPTFIDAKTFESTESKSKDARIIFYLAAAKDDEKTFYKKVVGHFSSLDIVVLCLNGSQLREAVSETLALKRVQINRQELNSDQVAKREFHDRVSAAEFSEDSLLDDLLNSPKENIWFNNTETLNVTSKRSLQEVLSSVLQEVYSLAPVINNELINRDKLSAQAASARNKLLLAMLNHENEADLGIDKFPAEKAIYRSLLSATGLHKQVDGEASEWKFAEPEKDGRKDKSNLRHVWACINDFLDSTESSPRSFTELNQLLMSPPYGLKAGVLPIFYITAYLSFQHELAMYENRSYKPYINEEILERFIKRPDDFTFQRFRIKGLRASIFKQYSKVIHGDDELRTLLELSKPLAIFLGSLPEYTQKTHRGLTKKAEKVRAAFNLAKSPERLLFNELPEALGFKNLAMKGNDGNLEKFSEALTVALRELKDAYKKLLRKQKGLLAQAFNFNEEVQLPELRKLLSGNCAGLENYTIDTNGLRAFIMRINKSAGTDEEWFEGLLMFLGHKPSVKWLDSDQDAAEYRLVDFSRGVIDLEKIRLHEKDSATQMKGDFDVYLLRSIKKGGDILNKVVAVDENSKKTIASAKKNINDSLSSLGSRSLMLAALAETVDEYLQDDLKEASEFLESLKNNKGES